jgi:DNA polymerase I
MTAVAHLPTGPARESILLSRALREAAQLGAKFRISGADVVIGNEEALPAPLREALGRYRDSGLLYQYLDYDDADAEALDFSNQTGVEPVLVDDGYAARLAVRRLIQDMREHGAFLGLDIETAPKLGCGQPRPWTNINIDGSVSAHQTEPKDRAGLSPHTASIRTIQLYAGGQHAVVFIGAAAELILQSHWLRRQHLIIHNAGFEVAFLMQRKYRRPAGRKTSGRFECTSQGSGLLTGVGFGSSNRSLANAVKSFLDLEIPKSLQTSDWGAERLSEVQIAYAAMDAVLARRLWAKIEPELRSKDRWAAYELQRNAIPAVADMELRGLGFDREEHARQVDQWSTELAEARRAYHALTGQPPPTKPNEVRELVILVIGQDQVPRWPTTPTGEISIETKHLKRLVHVESARPVLDLLARAKLLSTFGAPLAKQVNTVTGRLHASYSISGAKSGRFSCTHPNLQQVPASRAPEFKKCIVAAPGNVLVGCDWSQIEMRAAAWISGDPELTRVYAEGRDIHSETAARIAGIPVEAVTKEQRQAAKAVNFGSIYGIGPRSLSENAFATYGVEMSTTQAKIALERFFAAYRKLDEWRNRNLEECKARGYVKIGAGRVVEASWEPFGLSFPQCCNLPVQGICADAMLRAIAWTYSRLNRSGIRGGLVACVHDELLLEIHENDAERAATLLQQTMVDAFIATFPKAPTNNVAEVKIEIPGQN